LNKLSKILFWIFTIGLGFVNPLISFGLIILYYLPSIIQDLCNSCKEGCQESTNYATEEFITFEENGKRTTVRKDQVPPKMDSYSEDTLEDLK
jgi:hypothetical protein